MDSFYSEIRNNNKLIRNIDSSKEKEKGNKLLFSTVDKMCHLSRQARSYGLLALEEEASKLDSFPGGNYLNAMLMLIVDGTNPELVSELCTCKYYAEGLEGYEALQYIMMLDGCLLIQSGENPIFIEKKLLSMLAEEISSEYYVEKAKTAECNDTCSHINKDVCAKSENSGNSDASMLTPEEIAILLSQC